MEAPLGANVAVEVARRSAPAGVALEAPFPSLAYMAKLHYPFVPVRPFLGGRYDTEAKIREVTVRLLVIQGGRDNIVPLEAGRAVFEAAPRVVRSSTLSRGPATTTFSSLAGSATSRG